MAFSRAHGRVYALVIALLAGVMTVAAPRPALADTVKSVSGTALLTGVACTSSSNCVAVGLDSSGQTGVVVPTSGPNVGAVEPVSGSTQLYSVACATATSCVAVGTGNYASQGVVVPISNGTAAAGPAAAITVQDTAYLHGVSCMTGTTSCVAVGWQTGNYNGGAARIGVVVPIDSNGNPLAVEQISGTLDLDGVFCNGTTCMAVGLGASNDGVFVPVSNGTAGGEQDVPGTAILQGIACPSATRCTAAGEASHGSGNEVGVVVTINNNAVETTTQAPDGATYWGVACASTSTCWAAASTSSGASVGGFAQIGGATYPGNLNQESGTSRIYGVACLNAPSDPNNPSSTSQVNCVGVGQAPPLGSGPGVVAAFGNAAQKTWKDRDKAAAKLDAPGAIQNAVTYCTPSALGFYGFTAGSLMISTSGALVVATLLTTYVTAPFCTATVTRVATDYFRAKDPPDPAYDQLAQPAAIKPVRMPSCSRWTGSKYSFCKQLSPAERKWAEAAEQVASISGALETTLNRESGAVAAGNQSAAQKQDNHIPDLEGLERTALANQASAGRAVAHLLQSHNIGWRVSKSQNAKTINDLEKVLAKKGISASQIKQFAPGALTPRAIDIRKALANG